MIRLSAAAALALLVSTGVYAQEAPARTQVQPAQLSSSLPVEGMPVNTVFRQNVYDPTDQKIGEVTDLLVDRNGRITTAIVAVGGFLGIGEKEVAVPYSAITQTKKDDKTYLVMNTTKDALKGAAGFRYDKSANRWVPDVR
jgi:sporulation protein YlmC with PRC-barrel domain